MPRRGGTAPSPSWAELAQSSLANICCWAEQQKIITSVQQRAAGRKVWFAQSNFLPATIVRHFVPRIVLYYCSNLVKNLSLSLKQSDIERKELKKRDFFPRFI